MKTILQIINLSISSERYVNRLKTHEKMIIKDLNLTVNQGEIIAIIGESGSGKSIFAHSLFGSLPDNFKLKGEIHYKNQQYIGDRVKELRGKQLMLIPQTVESLDPTMKVGKQVQLHINGKDKVEKQRAIFQQFALDDEVSHLYPFQLSGGMARRVLACMAMVSPAEVIVADEPTPGMDIEAVNELLFNLKRLNEYGSTILMISHDITTALKIAHRIAVFKDGGIVEVAMCADFEGEGSKLKHPFTKRLWRALPQNDFTEVLTKY